MKERNLQLDYLKIVLSILVIGIHTPLFLDSNINIIFKNGISRIAVPTFLIINGYYFYSSIDNFEKFTKLIKRLIILYLIWWLLYLPFFYKDFDFIKIINGYMHLWYLSHLALSMIFLYLLKKILSDRVIFIIAILLFLVGYVLQSLRSLSFSFPMDIMSKDSVARNFIFFSFPFLFFGYSMNVFKVWKKLINYKFIFIVLGIGILIIENIFFYLNNINFKQDIYLGCLLVSPFLFLYFRDKPKKIVEDDFFSKLYISIYLIHVMVIYFVDFVFQDIENFTMRFVLKLFLTLLVSINIIYLNRKIKIFL